MNHRDGQTSGPMNWRAAGSVALGCVFLYAALSKLYSIHGFASAIDAILASMLGAIDLPFASIRTGLTISVLAVEIVLGVVLVGSCRAPRWPALAAALLLGAFALVLLYMGSMARPPRCACLGAWNLESLDARAAALLGFARNIGLIVFAVWVASAGGEGRSRALPRPAPDAAFTLIETLVVISVLAVILAIALPVIGSSRRQGKVAVSLSAMRQCHAAVSMYASAERGFMPYLATPEQPALGTLSDREWPFGEAPTYFRGQSSLWPSVLLDHGIDLSQLPRTSRLPEYPGDIDDPTIIRTFFWLTHAAHARPEYWVGFDPPSSDAMYSGVRLDEAVFPASKGMFVDLGLLEARFASHWSVAMVDGSASVRTRTDPPVMMAELPRPYGAVAWRVLTTHKGMRGIDY
ncbi:MAG: type II secretion system GspH family protein [Phycisphaerales bacterium]|nr:type II secretion system GspH family protein [Phycisphaerales bacterium]